MLSTHLAAKRERDCVTIQKGLAIIAEFCPGPAPGRSIGALFTRLAPPDDPAFNVLSHRSGLVPSQYNVCVGDADGGCVRPCVEACKQSCNGDSACMTTCGEGMADVFAHEGVELGLVRNRGPYIQFTTSSTVATWHHGRKYCRDDFPLKTKVTWTIHADDRATFVVADVIASVPSQEAREIGVARLLPFVELLSQDFTHIKVSAPRGWRKVRVPTNVAAERAFVQLHQTGSESPAAIATRTRTRHAFGLKVCPGLKVTPPRDLVFSAYFEPKHGPRPNLYFHASPTSLKSGEGQRVEGRMVYAVSSRSTAGSLDAAMAKACQLKLPN